MTETSNLITKKIGELFDYTIPGEWGTEGDPENDIPVLRSTNFTNEGRIDYSNLAFRRIDSRRLALRLVNKETILIEKSGGSPSQPAGRIVYCDENFNGSASNFIEIAKINNLFCPKYIFFLLHFLYQSGLVLKYQQQTTGIINFKLEQYKNEEVLLPCDKQEQTQIATILSTIDRAIEQTEALIAKQQRIKTGLMQDLLTKGIDENGNIRSEETHKFKDSPLGRIPVEWEVEKIEQKLERIIDYRGQTPKKVTEGIPLLTAKNVRDGFIEKEPQEFIADSAYNSWMSRGIPEVGDVLFTTEAPMGNVASIPNYRIALAQRLLTLCPKINELSQDFLFWILHWKRSKERIELLTSGSTVVGIKQSVFRKVIFAFPSYNEQERIYAVLNSHDEINKNEKHKLKKLQRLKTGLMQDLLTGKVRVTDILNQKAAVN